MRIARPGEGKPGGYGAIVFFSSGERTFFVYGFAKSRRDDISDKQLRQLKMSAKVALRHSERQLGNRVKTSLHLEI